MTATRLQSLMRAGHKLTTHCPNTPTGSSGSQTKLRTQHTIAEELPLELHRLLH